MRFSDLQPPEPITTLLREAPHFAELTDRDGLACRVWRNPSQPEFRNALRRANNGATDGLRGLLTAADLYVWQSLNLLHGGFERDTGIEGIRVGLRGGSIQANDETVALPEAFPWVFADAAAAALLDVDDRRKIVADWLRANPRLKVLYPAGFAVTWYQ